jgi:hypothetical protein
VTAGAPISIETRRRRVSGRPAPRRAEDLASSLARIRRRIVRLSAFLVDAGLAGEALAAAHVAGELEALERQATGGLH